MFKRFRTSKIQYLVESANFSTEKVDKIHFFPIYGIFIHPSLRVSIVAL